MSYQFVEQLHKKAVPVGRLRTRPEPNITVVDGLVEPFDQRCIRPGLIGRVYNLAMGLGQVGDDDGSRGRAGQRVRSSRGRSSNLPAKREGSCVCAGPGRRNLRTVREACSLHAEIRRLTLPRTSSHQPSLGWRPRSPQARRRHMSCLPSRDPFWDRWR